MQTISFFKLQAKNLYRDYKTQYTYIDEEDGKSYFGYLPKFYDIQEVIYEWSDVFKEHEFTLMKAQHVIAFIFGLKKWSDLINASEKQQELLMLLFKNNMNIEEWSSYISEIETDNSLTFEFEAQIEFVKENFIGKNSIFIDHSNPYILHNF